MITKMIDEIKRLMSKDDDYKTLAEIRAERKENNQRTALEHVYRLHNYKAVIQEKLEKLRELSAECPDDEELSAYIVFTQKRIEEMRQISVEYMTDEEFDAEYDYYDAIDEALSNKLKKYEQFIMTQRFDYADVNLGEMISAMREDAADYNMQAKKDKINGGAGIASSLGAFDAVRKKKKNDDGGNGA